MEKTDKVTTSTLVKNTEGYTLLVDGKPFYINGAGLEFSSIERLAAHGANSLRTWRVNTGKETGKEILDEAHRYGLKVMMGIEVARERHGFDYDDKEAVAKQLQEIKKDVMELKDHPALIIWGIGNELNLHAENPKVWDAVNEISKMIHQVDPNHLTTTSLAGMDMASVQEIKKRASDLDILSVQLYGELVDLPKLVKESRWSGPLIVSEWGATGYWEVPKTAWGAPIEENSSVKADGFLNRYHSAIPVLRRQCIGSYVFLWGQKQERTSTWFGFFTQDDRKTEVLDIMHYIWNGKWPDTRCPRIDQFSLNLKQAEEDITLKPIQTCQALVQASVGDHLTYRWEILRESTATQAGGDLEEVPEAMSSSLIKGSGHKVQVIAPAEEGPYRLYVYVDDQNDYTAHANIPFLVEK